MNFQLTEAAKKRTLVVVKQEGKSEEIISLAAAAEKYHLDLYDAEALRRGHTLNYPNFIIGPYREK